MRRVEEKNEKQTEEEEKDKEDGGGWRKMEEDRVLVKKYNEKRIDEGNDIETEGVWMGKREK